MDGADRQVEKLSERIAALAAERQELRRAGASDEVLEANRAQLGLSQWALSHALIQQHLPGFAAA
jgi:cell division protein FtsB